jgi:amino acid adenylation domain-containing protein
MEHSCELRLQVETTMSTKQQLPRHEVETARIGSARGAVPGAGPPVRPKAELDRLLDEWSRTGMPFPRECSVVDFFRGHAQRQPHALALSDGVRELDFGTLDQVTNRMANRLLREGLKPEDIVALPMERSCGYVIAALGVLKAGGAYMPIDVHTPDERLWLYLEDSGAKFAVTAPEWVERLEGWKGKGFGLDEDALALAGESAEPPNVPSDPDRRAYVIYTSGSTGQPKGVEVEHHSLTNLVCVYHAWLGLTPDDRGTVIVNVAFDVSVVDLWPVLCAGGTILVAPKELGVDLDGLIQWLAAERVTYSFIPTALVELLLTRPWPHEMALRFLYTGGDTLHVQPPPGLSFRVINAYGPAENTVISTWSVLAPGTDGKKPPIGRPLANVKIYVLDEDGQPVPPGEEGELYLGGEQVARGYLNRPELTSERFLPDRFAATPGARMYRTGDWVRQRPDGELDFIGRRDRQVQIRGQRVELGEIEQMLHCHPSVRQASCEPMLEGEKVTGVVAHVVANQSQLKLDDTLRAHLAGCLPAYMVPKGFIFHERLPLTERGKVDRAALRAAMLAKVTHFEASLPEGSPKRAIAHLWFQLLPLAAQAEIHASFDTLGGDSLHAVNLLLGVEKISGRRILVSDFMVDPTLPGLLRLVENHQPEKGKRLIAFQSAGHRPPVFCLYGIDGDVYHYLELSKALGPDQPVFGIRSHALDDLNQLPKSLEEAGASALRSIRERCPDCLPALIGYSWSGMLAFEIARQWLRREGVAPFVAMIGAPAPRRRTTTVCRVWHLFRWLPAWLVLKAKEGPQCTPTRMLRRFLRFLVTDPAEIEPAILNEEWTASPIAQHLITLQTPYHPALETPFDIHLFRESRSCGSSFVHPLDPSFTDHQPDSGWSRWAGRPVQVHWLDTDHDAVLHAPVVNVLAARLRTLMDQHYAAQNASPRRQSSCHPPVN